MDIDLNPTIIVGDEIARKIAEDLKYDLFLVKNTLDYYVNFRFPLFRKTFESLRKKLLDAFDTVCRAKGLSYTEMEFLYNLFIHASVIFRTPESINFIKGILVVKPNVAAVYKAVYIPNLEMSPEIYTLSDCRDVLIHYAEKVALATKWTKQVVPDTEWEEVFGVEHIQEGVVLSFKNGEWPL